MDYLARQRATVISTIVRDVSKSFWVNLGTGARATYLDVFHQISLDPNILPEQRIDALYQMRHFRMETLLATLSKAHGLACSPTVLVANNRTYVYAASGAVGITQAYVQAIGDMPKPAKFRERRAALNKIVAEPQLDFGCEPRELLRIKDFYGIIAHNPAGRRFTLEEQSLGMIQYCIPVDDCSCWGVELPIQEIAQSYPVSAPDKRKGDRELPWKHKPKRADESDE